MIKLFKDLEINDIFSIEYEINWAKDKPNWRELPFIGVYKKVGESEYLMVDAIEDRRPYPAKRPKIKGCLHKNANVITV